MVTEIIVAAIAATPMTITAYATLRKAKQVHSELRGNGLGTHTEMLERCLVNQGALSERVDRIDAKVDNIGTTLTSHIASDEETWEKIDGHIKLTTAVVEKVLDKVVITPQEPTNGG